MAGAKDRAQCRMDADRFADRLEPALDAAIELVVVAALVMRLMRLAQDPRRACAEAGEAAAAIAPALGNVGVDAEIVPAPGKAGPIAEPGSLEHRAHFGRAHQGETI